MVMADLIIAMATLSEEEASSDYLNSLHHGTMAREFLVPVPIN